MSACEEIRERLGEFLDGELPQAERPAVEAHLQGCPACREELGALRAAASAVRSLERPSAPASILAGVRSGLRGQPRAPTAAPEVVRPDFSLWLRRALSAAAVLMVAVLVYLAYVPQEREQRALAPASSAISKTAKTAAQFEAGRKEQDASARLEMAPGILEGHAAATVENRVTQPAQPKALERADAEDVLSKARSRDEAASARVEQGKRSFEGKTAAGLPDRGVEFELTPQAPAPVAQGTPPNVAEGTVRPLAKEAVTQPLKGGWEVARSRPAKAEAGPEKRQTADPTEGANDDRGDAGSGPSAATPVAIARQEEMQVQTVQTERLQRDEQLRQRELAEDRLKDVALGERIEPRAPASPSREERPSGNEGLELAEARKASAVETEAQEPLQQKSSSALAAGRQVLTVPAKNLDLVLEDLRRLAAASGGELAWQPATHLSTDKKDQWLRVQSNQAKAPLGAGQVVIRVPQARMDELLRATEQYRAKRRLNMEPSDPYRTVQLAEQQQGAVAGKAAEGEGEAIQLVLDIRPQTVPAAAEAVRTERQAPAESNR